MPESFNPRSLIAAITAWARADAHGCRSSGSSEGLAYLQMHTRPDPRAPEVQITFRAVLVDGRPMIRVDFPDSSGGPSETAQSSGRRAIISIGPTPDAPASSPASSPRPLPPSHGRDPTASCEACGAIGTVGRATRTDAAGCVMETHTFCSACWPEQSARYRARWKEEDRLHTERFFRGLEPARGAGPGMWFESATWHGTLELVRQIESQMIAPVPPSPQALAGVAEQIEANRAELDGEMPFEVEMFIRRYAAPAE